jgi:NAD(P) transhydrogenase
MSELNGPYDLVVIGSGPAGEKGAAQAAYFGKRVALIEREDALGGAACNTGTLPSKTLRETAVTLSAFRSRDLYGIDLSLRRQVTVQDLMLRAGAVKSTERLEIANNVKRHQIDLFNGSGSFAGPNEIWVTDDEGGRVVLQSEKFLIASGSSPRRLDSYPLEDPRVWDSDQILNLERMPRRMAIVGAGVIGCEYACVFAALGVEVFLIHDREHILPFLDRDVCTVLQSRMGALGVTFLLGDKVIGCKAMKRGIRIELQSKSLLTDAVLVAAGRTGNVAALNLGAVGISPNKSGFIQVNENFQTEAPHVYAAGDVIGFPALASTSMEQARMAMVHAFDLKYKKSVARVLPLAIYTIPEVAAAGETEMSLLENGVEYVVGRAYYDRNARGKIIGDREGMLKLLFRRDDMKLLGVGVVGEMASEVVHVGLIALMVDAGTDLFIETCFNYPTLGQLYKYATYDAMQQRARTDEAIGVT